MSSQKKYVLLLQKGNERKWSEFDTPECRDFDRRIYEKQGYIVQGETDLDIADSFPAFKLEGYGDKDECANRFGEIFQDVVPGKYGVVGVIGKMEVTRENMVQLRSWLNKAIKHCGEGPMGEDK